MNRLLTSKSGKLLHGVALFKVNYWDLIVKHCLNKYRFLCLLM